MLKTTAVYACIAFRRGSEYNTEFFQPKRRSESSVDGHTALCDGQQSGECRKNIKLTIVPGKGETI